MKKKLTVNSTRKIGQYLTLKEARMDLVKQGEKGSWAYPVPIFRENDGTYSVRNAVVSNATFIEAVDPKSGRRFDKVKQKGRWIYVPKKKNI